MYENLYTNNDSVKDFFMNQNLLGKKIVVLTGAGISSESGLKTFRDDNGLWEGHRVEEVATPEAFARNPELVHTFYNLRRKQLGEVSPNQAHLALAQFEANHDSDFSIVTQNVDDLHERAGSKNVIHIHGELKKVRCLDTGKVFDWSGDLDQQSIHPESPKSIGRLRPHICWFGEIPFFMEEIQNLVSKADVFVAIGTSGVVYPAAGLVAMTKRHCFRVLLNKDPSDNANQFELHDFGPASQIVPQFFLHNS